MRMIANIKFSRDIFPVWDTILPIEYKMTLNDGKQVHFSFEATALDFKVGDRSIVECIMTIPLLKNFPDFKLLQNFSGTIISVDDFYVCTGDDLLEPLEPIQLLSLIFINDSNVEIPVSAEVLTKANIHN